LVNPLAAAANTAAGVLLLVQERATQNAAEYEASMRQAAHLQELEAANAKLKAQLGSLAEQSTQLR
jgi:hypothetical protein